MGTLEDRNRESVKREDPKEKDQQGVPQHEGGGSSDKYSREGQGKTRQPGEGSDRSSGSGRPDDDMEGKS